MPGDGVIWRRNSKRTRQSSTYHDVMFLLNMQRHDHWLNIGMLEPSDTPGFRWKDGIYQLPQPDSRHCTCRKLMGPVAGCAHPGPPISISPYICAHSTLFKLIERGTGVRFPLPLQRPPTVAAPAAGTVMPVPPQAAWTRGPYLAIAWGRMHPAAAAGARMPRPRVPLGSYAGAPAPETAHANPPKPLLVPATGGFEGKVPGGREAPRISVCHFHGHGHYNGH